MKQLLLSELSSQRSLQQLKGETPDNIDGGIVCYRHRLAENKVFFFFFFSLKNMIERFKV